MDTSTTTAFNDSRFPHTFSEGVTVHHVAGYRVLRVKDKATKRRRQKALHIQIWETFHKRSVPSGYIIHHLNGRRGDNRITNLIAMPAMVHISLHGTHYRVLAGYRDLIDLKKVVERVVLQSVEYREDPTPENLERIILLVKEGLSVIERKWRVAALPLKQIREQAGFTREKMGKYLRYFNSKMDQPVVHTRVNEWEILKRPVPSWVYKAYAHLVVDEWAERRLAASADVLPEINAVYAGFLHPAYARLISIMHATTDLIALQGLEEIRELIEAGFHETWGVTFGHVWRGVEGLAE